MGLSDLVRNAVATARTVTADLQVEITHEPCLGDDEYGNRLYSAYSDDYNVIIEDKQRWIGPKDTGQVSKARIIFLEAVEITMQDRITLPDGSQPQILAIEGVQDPDGLIYAPVVYF